MSCNNICNFFGNGAPTRFLVLSQNDPEESFRFTMIGDRWVDTNNSFTYINNGNGFGTPLQSFNLNMTSAVYNNSINACVNLTALTLDQSNTILQSANASGFFITADGFLVTSAHAVLNQFETPTGPYVSDFRTIYCVVSPENIIVPCDIIGVNRGVDIALLKMALNNPVLVTPLVNRQFLAFINSRNVSIGTSVFVLGTPASNTTNPQSISIGVLCNNSSPKDTLVEVVYSDVDTISGNSGGPLINILGQVVGVVQGGQPFGLPGQISGVLNFNSSYIITPILNYFMANSNTTGQNYPGGFFGIAGAYIDEGAYIGIKGLGLTGGTALNLVEGFQITKNLFQNQITVTVKTGTGLIGDQVITTVYPGSPADMLGLTGGDIILSAALAGQALMPVGKNQLLLASLIQLATNTGIIDITYTTSPYSTINTATGIGLTGIPSNFPTVFF